MPLLLGAKGKDILQWRASAELVDALEETLARKWGRSSSREAEALLKKFIEALGDELEYETELLKEVASLDEGIYDARSPEELASLLDRYREVVSAHFSRRRSVLAVCSICNKLHDRTASKALSLAHERMLQLGQGSPPLHALMVCGDRGRGEQTLRSANRYLLLHEEDNSRAVLYSRQLAAALKDAGLLYDEGSFWHGSLAKWRVFAGGNVDDRGRERDGLPFGEGAGGAPQWEGRLEAMSDLVFLHGDQQLGSAALDAAKRALQEERNRPYFGHLARRVIAMPLALGRFGRWRLEKDGEHRGEVDLESLAIQPLVMTVRVLAVHAGVSSGGTLDRIQALLEKGRFTVELSDRLLKAYQCLMQFRITSEIRSEQRGAYCTVEDLDLEEDERLRASLDTVLNLQKIAYQSMIDFG